MRPIDDRRKCEMMWVCSSRHCIGADFLAMTTSEYSRALLYTREHAHTDTEADNEEANTQWNQTSIDAPIHPKNGCARTEVKRAKRRDIIIHRNTLFVCQSSSVEVVIRSAFLFFGQQKQWTKHRVKCNFSDEAEKRKNRNEINQCFWVNNLFCVFNFFRVQLAKWNYRKKRRLEIDFTKKKN